MNRTYLVAGVVVLVTLALGLGAAAYYGVGPFPGDDTGEPVGDVPNGTPVDTSPEEEPFAFTVDQIEECGLTCRDVTATLHNQQDTGATDVTVYVQIYAGENNTAEDDLVWEGSEDVGRLVAGDSSTSTRRVELSLADARKVDQRDGWITIVTTVESAEETVTFQDTEQVA